MKKKKATSKTTVSETATKKSKKKKAKERSPEEVRKKIARMVKTHAPKMAEAMIGASKTGDLARVKYMFELAHIYPDASDGSEASQDDECFAKTLLDRLDIPDDPVGPYESNDAAAVKTEAAESKPEGEGAKLENGDAKSGAVGSS